MNIKTVFWYSETSYIANPVKSVHMEIPKYILYHRNLSYCRTNITRNMRKTDHASHNKLDLIQSTQSICIIFEIKQSKQTTNWKYKNKSSNSCLKIK